VDEVAGICILIVRVLGVTTPFYIAQAAVASRAARRLSRDRVMAISLAAPAPIDNAR
jgi:hypothetical protein